MEEKKVVQVVAAMIWSGDRFLICQRPPQKARGLLWEFVGGKVEKGETREEALKRECMEELAITLEVGKICFEVDHVYPDITIHLTLFHALIREGTVQKIEHNDIRWITKDEIRNFDFCPADEQILAQLENIPEPGAFYRHFKGNEYEVLCTAVDAGTPDLLVVYRDRKDPSKKWVRPYSEWNSRITRDGLDTVRFRKIDR